MNKKILKIIYIVSGILAVLVLTAVLFQKQIINMLSGTITKNMYVQADTDDFDTGLAVGQSLTAVKFLYKGVEGSDLMQFAKENGLVIMANRSLDWCPFCIKQAIDIDSIYQNLLEAGIGMVLITYDAPQKQQQFIDRTQVKYPIISDINGQTFAKLKILHPKYPRGDKNFGVPYAGSYFIDADAVVKAKIFIEDYALRVTPVAIQRLALQSLVK